MLEYSRPRLLSSAALLCLQYACVSPAVRGLLYACVSPALRGGLAVRGFFGVSSAMCDLLDLGTLPASRFNSPCTRTKRGWSVGIVVAPSTILSFTVAINLRTALPNSLSFSEPRRSSAFDPRFAARKIDFICVVETKCGNAPKSFANLANNQSHVWAT